jgi:hypothetical protein
MALDGFNLRPHPGDGAAVNSGAGHAQTSPRRHGTLVGLTVVGLCLSISFVLAWRLRTQYKPELAKVQDVMSGVLYFMERSGGRLPASESEFRAADFVETLADGAIRIRPQPHSQFRRETYGIPIESLEPFRIQWGRSLADLKLDEYGNVRDPDDKKVELIAWPSSPPSGKTYSMVLLSAHQKLTAAQQ